MIPIPTMPSEHIGGKSSAAAPIRKPPLQSRKDAAWIKGKKVVIWCFSAREFTESTSGWVVVPVTKK